MQKTAILLATYNGEEYLKTQLDSLYEQTFKDWSVYVHDDGSTDQTGNILKEYAARYDNFFILDYPAQHGAKNNIRSLFYQNMPRRLMGLLIFKSTMVFIYVI